MTESTEPLPTEFPKRSRLARVALWIGGIALLIIPLNFVVFLTGEWELFLGLALLQTVLGLVGGVLGIVHAIRTDSGRGKAVGLSVLSVLVGLGGAFTIMLGGLVAAGMSGGAWGRPLRVRGKQRHPSLRKGSDWTRGRRPQVHDLDAPTRRALEALWLHDAQKEHASVPAFSRVSWLLAAVGAPAELLEGAHDAALQEIDHARRCFALAAGYGGSSHSVEPMPELLVGALDLRGEPHAVLAVESLEDGCLLEDFNADVAEACVQVCEDAATRDVLERIAREEREHAEFSWAVVAWMVQARAEHVRRPLAKALERLARVPRPTAVGEDKLALVAKADPAAMRRHGRLEDAEWAALWDQRVEATRARMRALLEAPAGQAAA